MTDIIDAPTLEKLRSEGQAVTLGLAIANPRVVLACILNQDFSSLDKVTSFLINYVSYGSGSDVKPGMTCLVGSTPGGSDKGICRIRKEIAGLRMYVGETSDVAFYWGAYITVIEEYSIWPRHLRIASNTKALMDFDIQYTDQHTASAPVVVMGPPRVVKLIDGSISITPDSSSSWHINIEPSLSSSGFTFAWTCVGASALIDEDTATPTITFNAAGTYVINCTATLSGGRTNVGHRTVIVYDDEHPLITDFTPNNMVGSKADGGWGFEVVVYEDVPKSVVRDRAMAILVAEKDYHSDQETSLSIGIPSENIVAMGWIVAEDLMYDEEAGTTTFSVKGPQHWLKQEESFPLGIENKATTADAWTNMQNMTVDKMLWHLFVWRSTIASVIDCTLTNDLRLAPGFDISIGSIWQQMIAITEAAILANPMCDHLGRMFVFVDPQYIVSGARADIPVMMTLTKDDYEKSIKVQRVVVPPVSKVFLSGISYNGAKAYSYFSIAPGHVFKNTGVIETLDKLLLTNQKQANHLSGMILGQRNNTLGTMTISMGQSNRLIDIAPAQYVRVIGAATDTPRAIAFNRRCLPREVRLNWDGETGFLNTELLLETESSYTDGIKGDAPPVPPTPEPPHIPRIPVPIPFPKPPVPGVGNSAVYILTAGAGVVYTESFSSTEPVWTLKNEGGPLEVGDFTMMDLDVVSMILYAATPYGLYSGALGDEFWTPGISELWFFHEFGAYSVAADPDSGASITAFGLHREFPDCILLYAGTGYLGSRKSYMYFGPPASPIRKVEISWDYGGNGEISYGGDEWVMTTAGFLTRHGWQVFDPSADTSLRGETFVPPGHWHVRAKDTTIIYLDYSGNIGRSGDNMLTCVDTGFPCYKFAGEYGPLAMDCDDTGNNLLARRAGYLFLEKSTDNGTSWAIVTEFPEGVDVSCIRCVGGDSNKWIVAGVTTPSSAPSPVILYTEDFGDTWYDKTGDLASLIPTLSGYHKIIPVV